ncbi:Ubiquinone/menaquinone biosynthesis C-methylase UbiE [Nocardioides terrae]|uniref:Ubiquinone/menaquinone biosynthesis C-methylase UbiE n=1 Tax=Nocardioides terrae TaxID=574651 RepID=A0A1I1JI27_9ACTN|nr:class I SAM-dependent methyltransferase [Nocardioides terrae]SFC48116.1 Ubiquinone/menaquinone biosynthesis C-methylase UbiE [Nocardioides terrae]
MDEDRFHQLLHHFVEDLGATVGAGGVLIGDQLGLYRALATGAQLPDELAAATDTAPRYVEEWLRGQAAGGYVEYDAESGRFSMTEEQAFALTNPDGPVFLPGAFQLAIGSLKALPRVVDAFRTGEGIGWHEQDEDVFRGCERFFRPGYSASLVEAWLPALDGVEDKLRTGGTVADVGCGLGASTILMAEAYPEASFNGSDYHDHSIELARKNAADRGLAHRVGFEVAGADTFRGGPYDLVTTFDCLHDMGDPVATARHVKERLAEDGTWMVVEPFAGDSVQDNLNPVGRVYYSFSAFLCVPNAVSQGGARTLGAQAGEAAIRRVTEEAGFTRFRRAAETPFNIVYEVRP